MTIYTTSYPVIDELPQCNLWDFMTSNPFHASDDKVIFQDAVDLSKNLTYGQWKRNTRRWATALTTMGFQRGDTLAIFSHNQFDYSVVLFGAVLMAGIATTVNASYTVDEVVYQLQDSSASILVVHPELVSTAIQAADKVGISLTKVFVFGDNVISGLQPYISMLPSVSTTPDTLLVQPTPLTHLESVDTTAVICYSSGTTGRSKGVELTHANMIADCLQTFSIEVKGVQDMTLLGALPMYHIYSIEIQQVAVVYQTSLIVLLEKFSLPLFLKTIQDFQCQQLSLVPTQILMLAKSPETEKYDLSSMKYMTSAAAPLSPDLILATLNKFPNMLIRQGYGLTETSPVTHLQRYQELKPGSVGKPLPRMEARIVDPETGKDIKEGSGDRGELWVRGPNVMKGYRNNVQATRSTIASDGWLMTGDVVVVDKDGDFWVVDRLKELIKYNGFQVAPAELEALLISHSEIADAAVIGVYNKERQTEVPMAFVVKTQSSQLTEKDVEKFVATNAAKHKRLRGGVRFVESVPKSAAGKILRKELRALMAKEETLQSARL